MKTNISPVVEKPKIRLLPEDENSKFLHIKEMITFYVRWTDSDQTASPRLFLWLLKLFYLLIFFSYLLFKLAGLFIQLIDLPIKLTYIIF
jgi:hypothetical protein